MLIQIARFEIRYLLRNPLLWVTAALLFAVFFASMNVPGFELGSEGGLLRNAAYATVRGYLMVSLFAMFVTTAFVAGAVLRDDETGFGPIVRSTRMTKLDYLAGRFAGAFAVAALCVLLLPLAMVLGALAPWADPAQLGPTRVADHLYGYFLVALPNLLVHSALFFALATVARSMMAVYLGVIGFVSAYFVLDGAFADRPQLQSVVALADPFGARAIGDATRYWTVAERNGMLPDFTGPLLVNRLLWIGIALLCLAGAYAAFRFADGGMSKRERRKQARAQRTADAAPRITATATLPAPRHGSPALRALLWMRTRFEIRQVVLSPAFVVLMAWGMFTTLITLLTQRDPDGRPTYPTTLSMIPEIAQGLEVVPLIIAMYYAGELVWRERDRNVAPIIDATPIPGWAYVVSKTAAMALVLVSILLTSVVASVCLQLSLGWTELEWGKYLLWYVLPGTWDLLLVAALAMFVHALSPHKMVGWGVLVLWMVWRMKSPFDHHLLNYAASPGMPMSDMNGTGSFWIGAWTFRVFWGAFAVLLLVAAHLLWRRGTDVRLRPRLALARRRLAGAPGWTAGAALLTLVLSGAFAFYNTNVLNAYETQGAGEADAAAFERKYGRYAGLPQPTIVDLVLDVALYPDDRRAVTKGRYTLRNETAQSIPDVHVRVTEADLELTRAALPGARLVADDAKYRYRIYRLDRPLAPGETRVLEFETRLRVRGFPNGAPNTRMVENGTFLNEGQLGPRVSIVLAGMLADPAARRRHGLPEAPRVPRLEDLSATVKPVAGRGWARTDITVSTSADQTPIAPGSVVTDVVRGGRRTVRFVSDAPIQPRFSIQSGRYAEKHRRHGGVDLTVYYHPAHPWNVDRMLDGLTAALDYYQANFGPYPFGHARIIEFPGYADFAQAFAGTIPYSETVGFIADADGPQSIDYATYVTAHELAHQYWAHQVIGAEMEGRELLSETLAQYSAQMVMKRLRGPDYMRRYLQFELDRYLEGRGNAAREPTLVRVIGQDYVTYRKGAVAMYLLQERMGEDRVNRALRSLLARYRFRGAPYPRSLDLVQALRAEARTPEEQMLITDLFERITLYHLETTGPTAVRRADGRWDVTVPVTARKFYGDGEGAETEAPLDERIEVGLFTAQPGRDAFAARDVVLLERRPIRSGRQVLRFVTDRKPTFAGIDPYNLYVDRNSADNVLPVQ
ncbi:ABC transporter permease/M1 family aminopeptidase [Longimicrobium sp.]|uniref:ABC transporter permease/M1 family aminopeptidase n=1 Tax=Longimicrobium sp. TaxID=2029185 RepID=UPI002E310715|nr:M1 family aminopeptidase [Longimicrobium sp.]HEX6041315.1 M1 family aminopeptidase [Longimicrobium sp.]